jgi:hypothetical protein
LDICPEYISTMSSNTQSKIGKKFKIRILEPDSLEYYYFKIKKEIPYVDVKPYSHNIISNYLRGVDEKFGKEKVNTLIEELDLEYLGWNKVKVEKKVEKDFKDVAEKMVKEQLPHLIQTIKVSCNF